MIDLIIEEKEVIEQEKNPPLPLLLLLRIIFLKNFILTLKG